jgi:hypothetical protein
MHSARVATIRDLRLTKEDLQTRLHMPQKEKLQMLDYHHSTQSDPRTKQGLATLGRLEISRRR